MRVSLKRIGGGTVEKYTWCYRKPLKIDKNDLMDLKKKLAPYDMKLRYKVVLDDEESGEFKCLNKMVASPFYTSKKIHSIIITGRKKSFKDYFTLTISKTTHLDAICHLGFIKTLVLYFSLRSIQEETPMKEELEAWANFCTTKFYVVEKLTFQDRVAMCLDLILFLIAPFIYLLHMFGGSLTIGDLNLSKPLLLIGLFFIVIKTLFFTWKYITRKVIFEDSNKGEEEQKNKNLATVLLKEIPLSVILGLITDSITSLFDIIP